MHQYKIILFLIGILFCTSLQAQKRTDSLPKLNSIEISGIGYIINMGDPGIQIFFESSDSTQIEFDYFYSLSSRIDFTPPLELVKKEYNIRYHFDNSEMIQKVNIDTTLSDGNMYLSSPRLCNQSKQGEIIYFYKNTDSLVNSYCDSIHHLLNRVSNPKGRIEITVFDSTAYEKSKETILLRTNKIKSILSSYGWKEEQIIFKTGSINNLNAVMFSGCYFGSELVYLIYHSYESFAPADVGMFIKYLE